MLRHCTVIDRGLCKWGTTTNVRRDVEARASNLTALRYAASRSASAAERCLGLVQEMISCTGTTPPRLRQWLIRGDAFSPLASVGEGSTKVVRILQ